MKLKSRIIVGFLMIILMPMLLLAATLFGISEAQHLSLIHIYLGYADAAVWHKDHQ